MTIPTQAEPISRTVKSGVPQQQSEIEPQACWCMAGGGGNTWWCEVDRELVDTQVAC